MKDLRARVAGAADDVAAARIDYDQGCPPDWRDEPNPDTALCEPMKAQGALIREVLDAENTCNELVDEYNAQVRRGAPNDGVIVLGLTKSASGNVIICNAW